MGEVSGEERWLVWLGSSELDWRNEGLGPEGQSLDPEGRGDLAFGAGWQFLRRGM